jgi:uncharacterized protein YjiS (DUF1127 family)
MHALKTDFFYDIDDLADVITPRRKTVLDRMVGRHAIGQILGDRFLYEVHGPFESVAVAQKPSRLAGLIAAIWAWPGEVAKRGRLRRAHLELSRLDDRMLKDIGISRGEIIAAVSGAPIHGRPS